jgi:serine/threonine protein kinase
MVDPRKKCHDIYIKVPQKSLAARQFVKKQGAEWDRDKKLWKVPADKDITKFLDFVFVLDKDLYEVKDKIKALGGIWRPKLQRWCAPKAGIKNGFFKFKDYWESDLKELLYNEFIAIDLIATSGQSEVFKGKHITTDDLVAIKVFRSDTRAERQAFPREMKILAEKLKDSPNIVSYLEWGERKLSPSSARQHFIICKWYEHNLNEIFQESATFDKYRTWSDWSAFFQVFLEVLADINKKSILHRDLKPANIFVDFSEDSLTPVIGDFGISKITDNYSSPTDTTLVDVKSQGYRPDITQIEKQHQETWDVYGYAATIIAVLTRSPVYDRETLENLSEKLENEAQVPKDVLSLIRRCVDSDPLKRPMNSSILLEELKAC